LTTERSQLAASATNYDISPELKEIEALTRSIAEREFRPHALEWEESDKFPARNLRLLADQGLLGATVPEEFGGGGGSWLEAAVILEQLGRCCYTTAMAALGELGVQTQAVAQYGTQAQKLKYLPAIARGELMCSICITEPDSGSDIGAMTTEGIDDGEFLIINGTKAFISRADVSGLFLVYIRFPSDTGKRPIGAVLVERGTPGLTIGLGHKTLGGENLFDLHFEQCRVPTTNVLVRSDGFKKMLTAFNGQRCLNAAISVGIAQGAQDEALRYVQERSQGGQLLARYQGIQWMLADNAIKIEGARLLVRRAAARAAHSFPTRYESAIAKTAANEMALTVTDSVMQIFGGHGYLKELPPERYLRWARYGPLGGGTPQIQRNGIAHELLHSLI